MPIVCTEVGPWYADIIGISSTMAIEIEIKKSKSDLLRDFTNKKAKHFAYANAETGPASFVPNYLYFYVPQELGETTVKIVEEKCPKAGVAIQLDTKHLDGRNTSVIKKPTRLRPDPPRQGFFRTAILRMSSELCGRAITIDEGIAKAHGALEELRDSGMAAAVLSAGALDSEDVVADTMVRARELALAIDHVVDFSTLTPEQQQKWVNGVEKLQESWLRNVSVGDAPINI